MKKISVIMLCLLLSACSNIDSVQVFDDAQAASLAQKMYGIKPAERCTK